MFSVLAETFSIRKELIIVKCTGPLSIRASTLQSLYARKNNIYFMISGAWVCISRLVTFAKIAPFHTEVYQRRENLNRCPTLVDGNIDHRVYSHFSFGFLPRCYWISYLFLRPESFFFFVAIFAHFPPPACLLCSRHERSARMPPSVRLSAGLNARKPGDSSAAEARGPAAPAHRQPRGREGQGGI